MRGSDDAGGDGDCIDGDDDDGNGGDGNFGDVIDGDDDGGDGDGTKNHHSVHRGLDCAKECREGVQRCPPASSSVQNLNYFLNSYLSLAAYLCQ